MQVMGGAATFVILETTPVSSGSEVGGWVTLLDGNLEGRGWAISLDGADEVHIEARFHDSPPPVGADAAAVVEVSCEGEMVFVNDAGERVEVPTRGGLVHRLRLSLRAAVDEEPTLVAQAWADAASPLTVVKSNDHGSDSGVSRLLLEEAADGLAGAGRIGDDIDRGTAFSLDELKGVAVAEVTVPGEARRLCGYFDRARCWTTDHDNYLWRTGWMLDGPTAYMRHEDHPDRLCGRTGALWSTPHPDHAEPHEMVVWWNWLIPPRDSPRRAFVDFVRRGRGKADRRPPVKVLPRDTVRTVTLRQVPGTSRQVTVRVEHSGLPQAWADDMAAWTTYQLAILAADPTPIPL